MTAAEKIATSRKRMSQKERDQVRSTNTNRRSSQRRNLTQEERDQVRTTDR